MKTKNIKRIFTTFVCMALVACTALVCNAAGSKIQIEKLDNMTIQLPDNMLGITRDSEKTDKYFSVFGLDYDKTMEDFKSSDIFMQAMDNQATTTVTVTMTRNGDSEGIKNYKQLSEEKLYEVRDSFISQGEYISCTPDQAQDIVWLMFDLNVKSGSDSIKAFQANTVYDGMSINVTIQHNGGDVTSADYQTLKSIISTVTFNSKAAPEGDFTKYVYIGIIALVIILFIIIMVAGKKSKKKNKKTKNEKILKELTDKYKSDKKPVRQSKPEDIMSIYKAYDELTNSDEEIISSKEIENDDPFDDYTDIEEEEVKVKIYEKPTVSDAEIDAIVNESKERLTNEGKNVEIIETKAEKLEPEEVVAEELQEEQEDLQTEEVVNTVAVDESENAEEISEDAESTEVEATETDETETESVGADENDEAEETKEVTTIEDPETAEVIGTETDGDGEDEEETDEISNNDDEAYEAASEGVAIPEDNELIDEIEEAEDEEEEPEEDEEKLRKEAERNTADDFDEGYDFFEEKPRRIVGIIDVDSSDLKNAVDYDVLTEEEKKAIEVETADDKDEKLDSFIETASKAGEGIKNFFVHCGYFCTNVSRLIKRKHAAKKRKKAEMERREKERLRRQQTAQRRDKNGLVKVHSATPPRPQSQRKPQSRTNQSTHKSPSRRPQQNNTNRRK